MDVFSASFDEEENLHLQHNGNPYQMLEAIISMTIASYGYIEKEFGVEYSTLFKYELLKDIEKLCQIGVSEELNEPMLCHLDKETNEMVAIPKDVINMLQNLSNADEENID